jgi:hypothetical protein
MAEEVGMAAGGSGELMLDSTQDTFEGTMPFRGQVAPPVPGLVHWAYSVVVEGLQHDVPFSVTLCNAQGDRISSDQAVDGVASIEGDLRQQTYELRIEGERPIAFRAIRSQTYGYRQ